MPNPSAPPPPPYQHPVAWHLQLFSADGSVIAEIQKTPHLPLVLKGDPSLLTLRANDILKSLRFFIPQPPYQHGSN